MDREGKIPPWLVTALVVLVLVVGSLAYYAGRFKRGDEKPAAAARELPQPGPPSPQIEEGVPTPAETPPTVTPSTAVLIEKMARTSSRPLVERSSQVVVPIGAGRIPTPPRIAIEIPPSPRPSPTPTVPELEQAPREAAPLEVTPEPRQPAVPAPAPPATPEPPGFPPTPRISGSGASAACGT